MSLSSYITLIIPVGWLFKKVKRMDNLLKNGKVLKTIKLIDNSIFNIGMSVCFIEIDKTYIGETSVIDVNGNMTQVDFAKQKFIIKDSLSANIVNKIESQTLAYLGNRLIRGSALRSTANNPDGDVNLVMSVGKNEIVKVSSSVESTGIGKWKVGFPSINGNLKSIGPVGVYGKTHVCGNSVTFLTTETKKEAENLKTLLHTSVYKFLVTLTKSSAFNSKTMFNRFPDVNLTTEWTDVAIYKHFNLTQEEIDYITGKQL